MEIQIFTKDVSGIDEEIEVPQILDRTIGPLSSLSLVALFDVQGWMALKMEANFFIWSNISSFKSSGPWMLSGFVSSVNENVVLT